MIKVYCKFCLELVDTYEANNLYESKAIFVHCAKCKSLIGYTI